MTGGVITSAGIVLAATFAALAVIPILFLAQIAFIVAFGVLLDTLVVRTLLVPALAVDLGQRTWWPLTPKPNRHQRELIAAGRISVDADVAGDAAAALTVSSSRSTTSSPSRPPVAALVMAAPASRWSGSSAERRRASWSAKSATSPWV